MIGLRLPDVVGNSCPALQPGEYVKMLALNTWYCCTPNGHVGNLRNHRVVEHEDGSITATPSILVQIAKSDGTTVELWHGYLELGLWRSC